MGLAVSLLPLFPALKNGFCKVQKSWPVMSVGGAESLDTQWEGKTHRDLMCINVKVLTKW